MPVIILSRPFCLNGRIQKEINLAEQKLTHRIGSGGVIHLFDDRNTEVCTLSPGLWDGIVHDPAATTHT